MNGNSDADPNFVIINDSKELESVSTIDEMEQRVKHSKETIGDQNFNKTEIELIEKQRHKLRLFDPQGIYNFRHIEISYGQSFVQICSLFVSLLCIAFCTYTVLMMTFPDQIVLGLGHVNDLNVLDKLCLYFLLIFTLLKVKKLIETKAGKYSIRYKIALCANSFNRVLLDTLKLTILIYFIVFIYSSINTPDISMAEFIEFYFYGVVGDTISFIEWFFTIIIVVRALKPIGKVV
jgi:hypothetical protein